MVLRRHCAVAALSLPSMLLLVAALLLLAAASRGWAFPEGAPWEAAGQEGCAQCHFDAPTTQSSDALTIEGLPANLVPGATYRFIVRLEDPALAKAGFLLSAWQANEAAGSFTAVGPRTEANGAIARSTEAGAVPEASGVAEWTVEWQAPEAASAPIVLEAWANAANDDQSPFGDATHRRVWQLTFAGGSQSGPATQTN